MNAQTKTSNKNIFPLLIVILSAICVIVAAFLLYMSFYATLADDRMKYSFAFCLAGVFASLIFYFLFLYMLNYARTLKILGGDYWARWEYPKESGKGDVYFCNEGVYDTDTPYAALDSFGSRFGGAEIPSDNPSVIRLTCYRRSGRFNTETKCTQDIPIPPGMDEDAKKVVQRFGEYPGRSSQFTKNTVRYLPAMMLAILLWIAIGMIFVAIPVGEQVKKEEEQQLKERAENRLKQRTEQITPLWNKIRETIEPQLEKLRNLPDGKLTAKEAGFDENSEVQTVLYGRCSPNNDFYVSVVLKKVAVERDSTLYQGQIISGAYNYTTTKPIPTDSYTKFCRPKFQEDFKSKIILSSEWVYGEINVAPLLAKPSPAANSNTNKIGK